jgi:FtsP/CotA-like multicopper oxidase with cupredoxin domain
MVHGRNGNVLLINGGTEPPAFTVEQNQVELWRVVNTANARTMTLSIEGARFVVLGTDGGRLEEPYVTERIEMPVGQRYDLFVLYDRVTTAKLLSHVLVLDDNNEVVEAAFDLAVVEVTPSSRTPRGTKWGPLPAGEARTVDQEVVLEFEGRNTSSGIEWMLNGQMHPDEPIFTFSEGETVRMRLSNLAGPEHPFHLHGQFFEVLDDRQPGLKDTVLVPGFETVEIVAYFDNPGRWMAHCHILEHAELGMMAEIVVE